MKLSNILPGLAIALAWTALAKDTKSKGKCTTALDGETGCSKAVTTPGWGSDKVVICRNGHWDVLVKCASRLPCWPEPEAWCHSEDGDNLPKDAFELWQGGDTARRNSTSEE